MTYQHSFITASTHAKRNKLKTPWNLQKKDGSVLISVLLRLLIEVHEKIGFTTERKLADWLSKTNRDHNSTIKHSWANL